MLTQHIQPLIHWLHTHPHWAGVICFLTAFAESFPVLGSFIPGSVTMTAIGGLIGIGAISFWPNLILAILGAIAGDGFSFTTGYLLQDNLRKLWPFNRKKELLHKGEVFFTRHGGKSIIIGRFVGPIRAFVPLIAGMMRMRIPRYLAANIFSAMLWAPAYILPGMFLSSMTKFLPPHMALRLFIILLIGAACIWIGTWLLGRAFVVTHGAISSALEYWHCYLEQHPAQTWYQRLKDPIGTHKHLALALIVWSILLFFSFTLLALGIRLQIPWLIHINQHTFYLFQSLRHPSMDVVTAIFTIAADKYTWLGVVIIFSGYVYMRGEHRLAVYTTFNYLATAVIGYTLKALIAEPRPEGFLRSLHSYAFPSGHALMSATALGFFMLVYIRQSSKPARRRTVLSILALLVIMDTSRLYLGAHWLGDVIGGNILGLATACVSMLFYQRRASVALTRKTLLYVFFGAWLGITAIHSAYRIDKIIQASQYQMASKTFKLNHWWRGQHIPIDYQRNHFGHRRELLNIQFVGTLDILRDTLVKQHWQIEKASLQTALQKLTAKPNSIHLPLINPLYHHRAPLLTLYKIESIKPQRVLVLRIWPSQYQTHTLQRLWLASLYYQIPHHHYWFQHLSTPKQPHIIVTFQALAQDLTKAPIKRKMLHYQGQTILLLKQGRL